MTDTRSPAARIPEAAWFKSSYSNGGNACVEVAGLTGAVAVRDSKQTDGPHLLMQAAAFASFVTGMRKGFDA